MKAEKRVGRCPLRCGHWAGEGGRGCPVRFVSITFNRVWTQYQRLQGVNDLHVQQCTLGDRQRASVGSRSPCRDRAGDSSPICPPTPSCCNGNNCGPSGVGVASKTPLSLQALKYERCVVLGETCSKDARVRLRLSVPLSVATNQRKHVSLINLKHTAGKQG